MNDKRKLIVFSGAGISAESGIKTFRDAGGLWETYSETLADIRQWKNHYPMVHKFYNDRRREMVAAQPNKAHKIVAKWERDNKFEVINLTQNIDDLFEKAGCVNVVHLHGKIKEMKCLACGRLWSQLGDWNINTDRCSCGCRNAIKPNVVFFGEEAPEYRKLYKTLDNLKRHDIWITVGTSHHVIPIHKLLSQAIRKMNPWQVPSLFIVDRNIITADEDGQPLPYHTYIHEPATKGMTIAEDSYAFVEKSGEDHY